MIDFQWVYKRWMFLAAMLGYLRQYIRCVALPVTVESEGE